MNPTLIFLVVGVALLVVIAAGAIAISCQIADIHNELREIRLRIPDDKGPLIGPFSWRKP